MGWPRCMHGFADSRGKPQHTHLRGAGMPSRHHCHHSQRGDRRQRPPQGFVAAPGLRLLLLNMLLLWVDLGLLLPGNDGTVAVRRLRSERSLQGMQYHRCALVCPSSVPIAAWDCGVLAHATVARMHTSVISSSTSHPSTHWASAESSGSGIAAPGLATAAATWRAAAAAAPEPLGARCGSRSGVRPAELAVETSLFADDGLQWALLLHGTALARKCRAASGIGRCPADARVLLVAADMVLQLRADSAGGRGNPRGPCRQRDL